MECLGWWVWRGEKEGLGVSGGSCRARTLALTPSDGVSEGWEQVYGVKN